MGSGVRRSGVGNGDRWDKYLLTSNQLKDKLNLNLIFKNRRLCGHDSEGGRTHIHPIDEPESHIFIDKKVAIKGFTVKALKLIEEREML